jgi:hypothetical protein
MLVNPRLGEETIIDIFLSGESAFPKVPAIQFDGTDMAQLPSGFFTVFVSAADATITIEKRQMIRPDLFIGFSTNADIVRCDAGTGQPKSDSIIPCPILLRVAEQVRPIIAPKLHRNKDGYEEYRPSRKKR